MRKVTIGLLAVLCLWGATSWKSQPQWRVVQEAHMTGGTMQISDRPIFTPERTGLYRLSAYCSALGIPNKSGWSFLLMWNDLPGGPASASVSCLPDSYGPQQQTVVIFSPVAGVPIRLTGEASGDMSSTYNAAFTIEQLQ
jgi:hypothetical protein